MADRKKIVEAKFIVASVKGLCEQLVYVVGTSRNNRLKIVDAIRAVRLERVKATLGKMDVERINYNGDGFPIKVLRENGYDTVLSLYRVSVAQLEAIKGISENGALKIKEVVDTIFKSISDRTEVSLSYENHTANETVLLKELYILLHGKTSAQRAETLYKTANKHLQYNCTLAEPLCSAWKRLVSKKQKLIDADAAIERLEKWLGTNNAAEIPELNEKFSACVKRLKEEEYWEDYRKYSIQYGTLLDAMDTEHEKIVVGEFGLDAGLQKEIEKVELDLSGLKTELRTYQRFGVQYIIGQKRVLLGDEMGLGKTIQAIAAMQSLKNQGSTHFMVVCPNCVLVNWCREIERFSSLNPIKIHGKDAEALSKWELEGGVAVTTYETINSFVLNENSKIAMLTVDEAHYVINPKAKRTKNVGALREASERVLYMTGTPLVNNVREMCFLIGCLQPEVAEVLKKHGFEDTEGFYRILMPVYLRRTREMVLKQLPELSESEVWCQMTPPEIESYKQDLATANNMMSLRRVSWSAPDVSKASKALAMLELCDRALRENRKVLVFSFFLETLTAVKTLLGDRCVGVIDGSLKSEEREDLVKKFNEAPDGAVLAGQITAMGVGMNIQAASVVILCEPQFTPAMENQAISRCYRLGQVNSVQAYRLLCVDSIDERIMELLKFKQSQFDAYADRSAAGELSLGNNEITDLIDRERKRWGIKS